MAKVTWLGDGDPQCLAITEGGVTFLKGKAETVPNDHNWMEQFKGNPLFAVDEAVEVPETDEEADAIREELDGMGVRYRENASLKSLRTLLASHTQTGQTGAEPAKPETEPKAGDTVKVKVAK